MDLPARVRLSRQKAKAYLFHAILCWLPLGVAQNCSCSSDWPWSEFRVHYLPTSNKPIKRTSLQVCPDAYILVNSRCNADIVQMLIPVKLTAKISHPPQLYWSRKKILKKNFIKLNRYKDIKINPSPVLWQGHLKQPSRSRELSTNFQKNWNFDCGKTKQESWNCLQISSRLWDGTV